MHLVSASNISLEKTQNTYKNLRKKHFIFFLVGDLQVVTQSLTPGVRLKTELKHANVDAETSAEQKINICDFKGGEIDFPHPPSENQGLILEYSVNSKSSCDAFIGNSHNMHYQLEIVSFDENVQKICQGLSMRDSQRPTLKILQVENSPVHGHLFINRIFNQ